MVMQREHTRARLPEEAPLDRNGNWTYADSRHGKDTGREDTIAKLRTAAAERAAEEEWDLMLEGAGPVEYDDPNRPEPDVYELAYGTTAAGTEIVAYSTGVHTWIEDPEEEGGIDPPMLQNCMEPAVIKEWTLWQMGFRGVAEDRIEWINRPGEIKLPAE